ncbi:MAG: PhzF family phenazine biosynthesis protein [Ferruginibacter sp.]
MKLNIYQIDAFTDKIFGGNPAAVVPLEKWIDEKLMQEIAQENNLAETVFFVPKDEDFEIRWFTPVAEVDLCGHATLASAYVLYNMLGYKKPAITFHSKSGPLLISKTNDIFSMDFPSWMPAPLVQYPDGLVEALGVKEIIAVYKHRDLLVELSNEDAVKNAEPDFSKISKTGYKIIITAKGTDVDFVSRFFAPTVGVNEDPVTGSAHAQLIPYWHYKLGKREMRARQLSKRGGFLYVAQNGDRVTIAGKAVFYMKGEIEIED